MLKKPLLPLALLAFLALLASPFAYAQTPDGETPANEGVCDELMYATPGLYGLCVAFCEAQDCEADFSLDDPFENCSPSSERLLEIYNRKKEPEDPDMPCIQQAECPCWTEEELAGLRFWGPGDSGRFCGVDRVNYPYSSNGDYWQISGSDSTGRYTAGVVSFGERLGLPGCYFLDICGGGPPNCLGVIRRFAITPEEHLICEAQVHESGGLRGFGCFLP